MDFTPTKSMLKRLKITPSTSSETSKILLHELSYIPSIEDVYEIANESFKITVRQTDFANATRL